MYVKPIIHSSDERMGDLLHVKQPPIGSDGGICCTTTLCVTIPDCTPVGFPSDLDGDGLVGITDFLALLAAWGPCSDCGMPGACPADLDGDCWVGILDLLILLENWM